MKKLLSLMSILFLMASAAYSQDCHNAKTVQLNKRWKEIGNGTYFFKARQCGYLYICDQNAVNFETACKNNKYTKVNKSLAGCKAFRQHAYLLEANQNYYFHVPHVLHTFGETKSGFAFVVDTRACKGNSGGTTCKNAASNCGEVSCIPKPNGNKWDITGRYSGSNAVSHWTINNKRQSNRTKTCTFQNYKSGSYNVCVYYKCGNKTYKCCKRVVCKPTTNKPVPNDNCQNTPSNCKEIKCTPTQKGDKWDITTRYQGTKTISAWYVNRQRQRTTSKVLSLRGYSSGTYYICVEYKCGNRTYTCCEEVVCKPSSSPCKNYLDKCNYVKCSYDFVAGSKIKVTANYTGNSNVKYWTIDGKRYNNRTKTLRATIKYPKKHAFYVICYYECNRRTYKCGKWVYLPT